MGMQTEELLIWDSNKLSIQAKLGELVQYFQANLPQSGKADAVKCLIDPTAIMPVVLDVDSPDEVPDNVIDNAIIPVNYDEGFPTIAGVPIWERLDGEPIPYYKLYKEYREMRIMQGTRSLAKLIEAQGFSGKMLNALARSYHWAIRVRAYDKYVEYEKQMMRAKAAEDMELKHAKLSNQLLSQAVEYLTSHPEQMSPKTAIDLAELAFKTGRVSVGLYSDKPGTHSGVKTQVNINNTQNNADQMSQVNLYDAGNLDESAVEKQTRDNSQNVGHLQSILHVLKNSGAFDAAQSAMTEDAVEVDYYDDEESE